MPLHALCIRFLELAIPMLCNAATKFRILATEKYFLQSGESSLKHEDKKFKLMQKLVKYLLS